MTRPPPPRVVKLPALDLELLVAVPEKSRSFGVAGAGSVTLRTVAGRPEVVEISDNFDVAGGTAP